jgi:integrase
VKLTDAAIAKVRRNAEGKADYIEWDDGQPGFGLRIRAGKSTWVCQFKVGGKSRRLTLGTTAELTPEQARYGWETASGDRRAGAIEILLDAKHGFDAAAARTQRKRDAARTFGAVVEKYLEDKRQRVRPKTFRLITYHLATHWRPLHGTPIASITRETVASHASTLAANNGNVTANRSRASLSAFFEWCVGEGIVGLNPVLGTNSKMENPPRERVLSDDEVVKVWAALPSSAYGNIVRMILLTGCRRDEIGSLKWGEVDLDARMLTIPKERTKNHAAHTVPLSDTALSILGSVERCGEFVFGAAGESGFGAWSKSKAKLDEAVPLDHWTLHDLRRTTRTGLGKLGTPPHVAEAVLNHLPPQLVRTYDRNTYLPEKRAALDAWASHIRVLLARADGANVLDMRRA